MDFGESLLRGWVNNVALRKRKPRRSGAFLVNRRTSLVHDQAAFSAIDRCS
jgi:hypothetical protein